jgi:transposase
MPRRYTHIKNYENEIFKLKKEGLSNREIADRFGIEIKQLKDLICRHNRNQQKVAAGIVLKKRGRPAKNCVVTEEDKIADLRYKLNRKDARIKQLEMENELMRDFLKETERK